MKRATKAATEVHAKKKAAEMSAPAARTSAAAVDTAAALPSVSQSGHIEGWKSIGTGIHKGM